MPLALHFAACGFTVPNMALVDNIAVPGVHIDGEARGDLGNPVLEVFAIGFIQRFGDHKVGSLA